jgi:biotin transport system substrate-specific component
VLFNYLQSGGKFMKTKTIVLCAIFAAILCIFSVMTIPIGIVPISMGIFGVMLTSIILGTKKGTISVIVYILLGAVGLPVFSGFKGGFQVLLGPTGGYVWSYILVALLIGLLTSKLPQNKWLAMLKTFIVCLIGIFLCYAAGTAQFMLVQKTDLIKSLTACVFPFIPFDIIKALIATYLGCTISKALKKAGLIG